VSEPEGMAEKVTKVVAQLTSCRERGLDDINVEQPPQKRVEADDLEQLARDYCEAIGIELFGRVAQIRRLLEDGLAAYSASGNEEDAELIEDLFFDQEEMFSEQREVQGGKKEGRKYRERYASDRLDWALKKRGWEKKKFDTIRPALFERFAQFLIVFVYEAQKAKASQQPAENLEAIPEPARRPRRWSVLIVAGAVVLAFAGRVVVVWATNHTSSSPRKTYTEQQGSLGAHTFNDPHSPSVTGLSVKPFEKVEVSCKVLSPVFLSLKPDGYWYRLASTPWNNKWYVAANTFLNGDTPGGPTEHNTDFKVPDC
jgi:hypothetical protein